MITNKYFITTRNIPTYIKYLIAKKHSVHEVTSTTGIFNTDMVAPLKRLLVSFEPIQAGSGTPSPTNVRPISGRTECVTVLCGKNLCDVSNAVNATNLVDSVDTDGKITVKDVTARWSSSYIGKLYVKSGEAYTISVSTLAYGRFGFSNSPTAYPRDGVNLPDLTVLGGGSTLALLNKNKRRNSFTSNESGYIYLWYCSDHDYATSHASFTTTVQVELGSTATDYEQYKGTTYTTDLGQTVYGGTLDVVSGLLTVDRRYLTVSDFSSWGGDSVSAGGLHWVNVPKSYPEALAGSGNICSHAEYVEGGNGWLSSIPAYSTAGSFPARIYVQSNSLANFRAEYPNLQAVYMLATPQTYQLTPQQINTLKGTNVVTIENGDLVELVYSTRT